MRLAIPGKPGDTALRPVGAWGASIAAAQHVRRCFSLLLLIGFLAAGRVSPAQIVAMPTLLSADRAGNTAAQKGDIVPEAVMLVRGYDQEHRRGIGRIPSYGVGYADWEVEPPFSGGGRGAGFSWHDAVPSGVPVDAPFRFHSHVPFFGDLAGRGRVEMYYLNHPSILYLIPVQGSQVSMVPPEANSWDNGFRLNPLPWFVDSTTTPTIAVPIERHSELRRRRARVFVEYLPGNALENRGSDFWEFPDYEISGQDTLVYWGPEQTPPGYYPHFVKFGTMPPIGDLRVTFSIDGYTSDTLNPIR